MHTRRVVQVLLVVLANALLLGPRAAAAQEVAAEHIHLAFVDAGYAADPPVTWNWTNPPMTSFRVYDGERVLLLVVYADAASAGDVRLRTGPNLVAGYGPTTWMRNVALVQSTRAELDRRYTAELDQLVWQTTPVVPPTGVVRGVDDDWLLTLRAALRSDL